MLINKNQIPVVALESMNRTHLDEIDIANNLHDLITKSLAGEAVESDLNEAIEQFATHVEQHFASEEVLMTETGFPAYPVHKGEHDRVRAELSGILNAWRQSQDVQPLATYLTTIHPAWAKNHIGTMDTMTAYYIAEKKKQIA